MLKGAFFTMTRLYNTVDKENRGRHGSVCTERGDTGTYATTMADDRFTMTHFNAMKGNEVGCNKDVLFADWARVPSHAFDLTYDIIDITTEITVTPTGLVIEQYRLWLTGSF